MVSMNIFSNPAFLTSSGTTKSSFNLMYRCDFSVKEQRRNFSISSRAKRLTPTISKLKTAVRSSRSFNLGPGDGSKFIRWPGISRNARIGSGQCFGSYVFSWRAVFFQLLNNNAVDVVSSQCYFHGINNKNLDKKSQYHSYPLPNSQKRLKSE